MLATHGGGGHVRHDVQVCIEGGGAANTKSGPLYCLSGKGCDRLPLRPLDFSKKMYPRFFFFFFTL